MMVSGRTKIFICLCLLFAAWLGAFAAGIFPFSGNAAEAEEVLPDTRCEDRCTARYCYDGPTQYVCQDREYVGCLDICE